MTQNSSPWDGIAVGDAANAPYSSNEWAHLWALLSGAGSLFPNYGILQGSGDGTYDPLQVIASGGSNIDVKVGAALVNGKLYETDAAVTLPVGANASGNPRIDTVVLRTDYLAQTIRAVIVQGSPAGSPVRPTLTQDASVWEIPLADLALANGFSSVVQTDITDRRRSVHHSSAGWQSYAHQMNYIFGLAAYTGNIARFQFMQPYVITGNMLVKQLVMRSGETQVGNLFSWGMYRQSANDQGIPDTLLNYVGGNQGETVDVVNGTNIIVPADKPFYLPPGFYWLAISNASSVLMPHLTISTPAFDVTTEIILTPGSGSFTIGQPIDTVANAFTNAADLIPTRLEGIVFGAAS